MNTCPLVTYPGQIIGWINGRPVRAIAGASPDGDGSTGDEGQSGGQSDGQDSGASGSQGSDSGQSKDAAAGQSDGQAAGKWDGKIESLDPEVQKLVEKYKNEAATASSKSRDTARKEAEQAILKKLGLVEGDEKPDPDKLAADLAEARTSQRQAAVELAVFKTASKHLGDSNALIDSRSFLAKVKDLDPSASDFEDNVATAAKQAVTDNPKLKATQAAASSSIDGPPGGERRGDKPKNLSDAIAGHYGTG